MAKSNVEEPIQFGQLLRQYRIAAGLTQEVLAERTGLGVRSIQHLESGSHLPHRETLQRLLGALPLGEVDRQRLERAARPAPRRQDLVSVPAFRTTAATAQRLARRDNLPIPLTSFIGRTRDVDEVRGILLRSDVRLLTLTGPGGVGKTRLGMTVAATVPDALANGVVFVPLGTVREPGAVALAVAQVLGLRDLGGRPVEDALKEFLRERALLLVLDNLEQIADAPLLVAGLLGACPRLKVLATSRRALQISGEHEYLVPSLDLPDLSHQPLADPLAQNDAVRLFVERARAVRPGLTLDDANVRAIAEICVRLDGLPLAIELAAARVRLLPPVALCDRLADPNQPARLRLLTGGAKDLAPRQQSLRATIVWSYDLLTDDERRLFRRLAMFVGSFSIGAAEAISTAMGDRANETLGRLESLVRDGLLVRVDSTSQGEREPRLALLETIREFALEQLELSGEQDAARRAHAEHYAARFAGVAPRLRTGEQPALLESLDVEQANLRAAMIWASSADVSLGLRIVAAAWDFWDLRGLAFDAIGTALRLVEQSNTPEHGNSPERLRAMATMVCTQEWPARLRAERWATAEDCLTRCRAVGDRWGMARSLLVVADRLLYADPKRAVPLLEEGVALAQELGEDWIAGRLVDHLGRVAWHLGDRRRARARFAEGLALFRRTEDRWGIAYALWLLGEVARADSAYADAEARFTEGLTLIRILRNHPFEGTLLQSLGHLAYDQGDVAAAQGRVDEAIAYAREAGSRLHRAQDFQWEENFARLQGDTAWAAVCHQASRTLLDESEALALEQAGKRLPWNLRPDTSE